MHAKTLAFQLHLSQLILDMNTRDVSHEESLITPPMGGSCLNQVLGHLSRTRNMALATMGQKSPYPMQEFDPYDDRTGVPFSRDRALPFEELRRRFDSMQQPLIRAITEMTAEGLAMRPARPLTGDPDETVGSNLATLVFHECYHVGQTGILRRIVGKPGVVKPPR
jgi:uncharacterized damage-inducible protein DinB